MRTAQFRSVGDGRRIKEPRERELTDEIYFNNEHLEKAGRVASYVWSLFPHPKPTIEDLVQEVWFSNLRKLEGKRPRWDYIQGQMKRLVIEFRRRSLGGICEEIVLDEQEISEKQAHMDLAEALKCLTKSQRRIVEMFLMGLNGTEISDRLGCTPMNVSIGYRAAVGRLKVYFGETMKPKLRLSRTLKRAPEKMGPDAGLNELLRRFAQLVQYVEKKERDGHENSCGFADSRS